MTDSYEPKTAVKDTSLDDLIIEFFDERNNCQRLSYNYSKVVNKNFIKWNDVNDVNQPYFSLMMSKLIDKENKNRLNKNHVFSFYQCDFQNTLSKEKKKQMQKNPKNRLIMDKERKRPSLRLQMTTSLFQQ